MVDYKILEATGLTQKRLQDIFTANPPKAVCDGYSEEDANRDKLLWERRQYFQQVLMNRIDESTLDCLKSAHFFQAVDLAWDSSTITKKEIPLVMYAQGRISHEACIKEFDELNCKDLYVTEGEDGQEVINMPRFVDISINLVRSIITRRVAAQSARFSNLYPFFKYESRSTSDTAKLKAEIMSVRSDIMADQFGYRSQQVDIIRDMLLYGRVLAFPRMALERDVVWKRKNISEEFAAGVPIKDQIIAVAEREGVSWVTPHPSRIFYDKEYPITSINADNGCEWFGFWDVCRFRDIFDNPGFFNRSSVTYNTGTQGNFLSYGSYFNQYYTQINVPAFEAQNEATANDRLASLNVYSSTQRDSSVFITHFYMKVVPSQCDMGTYPFPVWLHLIVANSQTVIFAEVMPSCPAAVFSYNSSPHRRSNLSMAHELMPFQDQVSNLFSALLAAVRQDMFNVSVLNTDVFPAGDAQAEAIKRFRSAMEVSHINGSNVILEASFTRLAELFGDKASNQIFQIVRSAPNASIQNIMATISQTIALAERVMALSPQEQAQLSPRETSATEVQIIAGTTENVYAFVSDAIDEGRAAMKRYIYRSLVSLGHPEFFIPSISRYPQSIVEKAGFAVESVGDDASKEDMAIEVMTGQAMSDKPRHYMISGKTRDLDADLVFSSRDGSERSSNMQSAQTVLSLIQTLVQPAVAQFINKDQAAALINSVLRNSGAGIDVQVEPAPGTGSEPLMAPGPMPPGQAPIAQPPATGQPTVLPQ